MKKICYIVIFSIIFIVSICLLYYLGRINNLKIIDWTAISSLIEISTLVVLIVTLFVMDKSRRESYKPKIFIEPCLVYLKESRNGLPYVWKEEGKDIDGNIIEDTPDVFINDYKLNIFNAGLGPALNIKISFSPDKDIFFENIKKYEKHSSGLIEIDGKTVYLKLIDDSNRIKYRQYEDKGNDNLILKKTYLKPYNNGIYEKINLPTSITLYTSLMIYFYSLENKIDNISFPSVKVLIEYDDIGRKSFKNEYFLKFNYKDYSNVISIKNKDGEIVKNANKGTLEIYLDPK